MCGAQTRAANWATSTSAGGHADQVPAGLGGRMRSQPARPSAPSAAASRSSAHVTRADAGGVRSPERLGQLADRHHPARPSSSSAASTCPLLARAATRTSRAAVSAPLNGPSKQNSIPTRPVTPVLNGRQAARADQMLTAC